MSDGELTQDEINALLRPINADNDHKSQTTRKTKALSQDEINQLLRIINAGPGPKSQRASKTEIPSRGVLSQDEINQLLRAIEADDDGELPGKSRR
jgi:flagellar motor switch protein FliM